MKIWKVSRSVKEKSAGINAMPAGKKWVLTNLPVRCIVTDVEICYKVFSQMVIICEKNRAQPRFFKEIFHMFL